MGLPYECACKAPMQVPRQGGLPEASPVLTIVPMAPCTIPSSHCCWLAMSPWMALSSCDCCDWISCSHMRMMSTRLMTQHGTDDSTCLGPALSIHWLLRLDSLPSKCTEVA